MYNSQVTIFWLFAAGTLLIAGCTKKETITEPVEVNTSIVGVASYSYGTNVRFLTPSFQSITLAGYDEAKQISATFNNQPLRRRDNYNAVALSGEYRVAFNQTYAFRLTIDGKSATMTDAMPDSVYITSHLNGAGVPANQPVLLQWNQTSNTDFYFVTARVEQGITFLFDSTFVTTANQASLPARFFPNSTTTTIDVFAVAGLPPHVTNASNLQGDLKGRIYFYVRTAVFRLRSSATAAQTMPAAEIDDDYASKKFREFIGAGE